MKMIRELGFVEGQPLPRDWPLSLGIPGKLCNSCSRLD